MYNEKVIILIIILLLLFLLLLIRKREHLENINPFAILFFNKLIPHSKHLLM